MSCTLSMCRLCLNTEELTDIYQTDGDVSVYSKIIYCIDLKMCPADGLPSVICTSCKRNIEWFYDFKLKCLKVDLKLRATLTDASASIKLFNYDEMTIKIERDLFNSIINDEELDNSLQNSDCNVDHLDKKQNTNEYEGINYLGKVEFSKTNKLEKQNKKANQIKHHAFQCEICGYVLKSKTTFGRHLKAHFGIKVYSCSLCPKTFTRAAQKAIHTRSHMGIRPFICDVCGQSSTKKHDLIRHMRIHSEIRSYPCPRCHRRFKRSYDVKVHMRSHTGVKPYSCKVCNKDYTSHSSLRKHQRRYCDNKPSKS